MARRRSSRGSTVVSALRAVSLLREAPRRPGDLAAELDVSLSTAKRILSALREAGEPVTVTKQGREAWYRIGTWVAK